MKVENYLITSLKFVANFVIPQIPLYKITEPQRVNGSRPITRWVLINALIMCNFLSFKPKKLLGKTKDSNLNSQEKRAVWKQFFVKASQKLKFLIAFLVLVFGNPFGKFNASFHNKNGPEELNLQINNDSVFNLELTRKIDCDTTLVVNFQKES